MEDDLLTSALSGAEPAPEPTPEPTDNPAPVEPVENQTPEPEATPEPQEDPKMVPYEAMIEERNKRKAKDKELQETRERLARLEGRMDATAQPEPQENPVAWETEYYANPRKVITEAARAAVEEYKQEQQNAVIAESEARAIKKYGDEYDALSAAVLQLVSQEPAIAQAAMKTGDPVEYAIKQVKLREQLNEVGDLEAWREKAREQIRKELEEEAQAKAADTATDNIVQPSASDRSASDSKPAEGGGDLLEQALTGYDN